MATMRHFIDLFTSNLVGTQISIHPTHQVVEGAVGYPLSARAQHLGDGFSAGAKGFDLFNTWSALAVCAEGELRGLLLDKCQSPC